MSLGLFYGNFMRGGSGHANLDGASFLEAVRTAPRYRLFSIDDVYPGLLPAETGGGTIAAELYEVPDEVWRRVHAAEPPELRQGPVELADGRAVDAMLVEGAFAEQHREITSYGGWAAYLKELGRWR